MNIEKIDQKKALLDEYRPLSAALVRNLEQWFSIELTYTSNSLEGNTLTRRETALVVEKGLTVGGKSLVEHLEATNHASALNWIQKQITQKIEHISEEDILQIHKLILKGIDDDNAGYYRNIPVRISGSTVILPNARKVPQLMQEFCAWLHCSKNMHPAQIAAEAHLRLVSIHPFIDGNGRTARLLMNMILLMNGYPAAIISPKERLNYLASLEKIQLGGSSEDYFQIIGKAIERSLNIYLQAFTDEPSETQESSENSETLLKIGQLAKAVSESNSTIRHWTQQGLLWASQTTASGYQLYSKEMIERVKQIHALKKQRYTLKEIKSKLSDQGSA